MVQPTLLTHRDMHRGGVDGSHRPALVCTQAALLAWARWARSSYELMTRSDAHSDAGNQQPFPVLAQDAPAPPWPRCRSQRQGQGSSWRAGWRPGHGDISTSCLREGYRNQNQNQNQTRSRYKSKRETYFQSAGKGPHGLPIVHEHGSWPSLMANHTHDRLRE